MTRKNREKPAGNARPSRPTPVNTPPASPEQPQAEAESPQEPVKGVDPTLPPTPSPVAPEPAVAVSAPEPSNHPFSDMPRGEGIGPNYTDLMRRAERQSRGQGLSADRELLMECAEALKDLIGYVPV